MNGEQADRLLTAETSFWARVEVVGRRTHYGKVSIEALGGVALLRVDIPPTPEHTVEECGYFHPTDDTEPEVAKYGNYAVTYPSAPGSTVLVGFGSIYELTPMAEATVLALAAREARGRLAPIKAVRLSEQKQIKPADDDFDQDENFIDDEDDSGYGGGDPRE